MIWGSRFWLCLSLLALLLWENISPSFHPHTVVRWLLQQLCADHGRTVGGWVGERKGRMGKMGKKGRVHEVHGTASVGKSS